jgi:hypothetical protein
MAGLRSPFYVGASVRLLANLLVCIASLPWQLALRKQSFCILSPSPAQVALSFSGGVVPGIYFPISVSASMLVMCEHPQRGCVF